MNTIRDRLDELGMTQAQLVMLVREDGITMDVPTMSKIINESVYPTPKQLSSISRHLQAPNTALFDDLWQFCIDTQKAEENEISEVVAKAVPFGKANAVKREDLPGVLGTEDDRKARRMITEARLNGVPICTDRDGTGYYQTDDENQIRHQARVLREQAFVILRQAYALERKVKG